MVSRNLANEQDYPSAVPVSGIETLPEDTSLDICGTSVTSVGSPVQKVNSGTSSSVEDYKSKNDAARHRRGAVV